MSQSRYKRLRGFAADLAAQALQLSRAGAVSSKGFAQQLAAGRLELDRAASLMLTDPDAAAEAMSRARLLFADLRADSAVAEALFREIEILLVQIRESPRE